MTTTQAQWTPGTRLPNGAVLIDAQRPGSGDKYGAAYVVVAHFGGDLPWVTWFMQDDGSCSCGNYYRTLAEAVSNYERRIQITR